MLMRSLRLLRTQDIVNESPRRRSSKHPIAMSGDDVTDVMTFEWRVASFRCTASRLNNSTTPRLIAQLDFLDACHRKHDYASDNTQICRLILHAISDQWKLDTHICGLPGSISLSPQCSFKEIWYCASLPVDCFLFPR